MIYSSYCLLSQFSYNSSSRILGDDNGNRNDEYNTMEEIADCSSLDDQSWKFLLKLLDKIIHVKGKILLGTNNDDGNAKDYGHDNPIRNISHNSGTTQ